jgi:pimeloyl-[acyl-carrier protein] methyl ester esterase
MQVVNALTLSGWSQPHDALHNLAQSAVHVDYHAAKSRDDALRLLAPYANVPLVIGWSLGGVLLMHACALGIIRPHRLVLLSSPLQFVADVTFPYGMGQETFALFQENFRTNPKKSARNFTHLIADGDTHYQRITAELTRAATVDYDAWIPWLNMLETMRHDDIALHQLPPTLLIYGEQDKIVSLAQGHLLHERIPSSTLLTLPQCAHAPHLHDAHLVQSMISQHTGYALA